MASTIYCESKKGRFYKIRVSRGKGVAPYETRWYIPETYTTPKAVERGLKKAVSEFEQACANGEIETKVERIARENAEAAERERIAAEEAKILTVKQYGEDIFLPTKSITCSEYTRSNFSSMLRLHVYPVIGDRKITDVTSADLNSLLLGMQQNYGHATCCKVYVILSLLFEMAYLDDSISKDPMDKKVRRPKPRKDEVKKTEAQSFNINETQQIIEGLENLPHETQKDFDSYLKWKAYVLFLIDSGVRRGEACGLHWEDIDFQSGIVTIKYSLGYTPEKGIYLTTTKNSKIRTIDISEEVIAALKQYKTRKELKLKRHIDTGYVFTSDDCISPMHPTSPQHFMREFAKKNGIENMHPHKLRHTFASIAITSGADVASVSEKLGHSDKAVTLRMYTHADQDSIKKAGNIFREALRQAK